MNAFEFVDQCTKDDRSAIIDACSCLYFKRGQTLIWEGNQCTEALLFASGRVRIYLIGPNGREVQLYRLENGQACAANLLSVLNGSESMVHVVAETDVMALKFSADDFHQLMQTNTCFHKYVMEEISSGMSSLISVTKTLAFVRVEQRVTDFLMNRCVHDGENHVIYTTHADIASELGTAREVVSRILKQFEKAGAIKVSRGKIIVKSLGDTSASHSPAMIKTPKSACQKRAQPGSILALC
ncbi:MAG: Crp/Fnr family transcriptional regulator [Gammaproteobacteria bacterium]|nr:Crp/Fnr family transcriptional regulator [Gammaproteobacteria bacterium]